MNGDRHGGSIWDDKREIEQENGDQEKFLGPRTDFRNCDIYIES